jgi:hypothetical protein
MRSRSHAYGSAFEEAWRLYPGRDGDNPKFKAFRAWKARLDEGATAEEMTDGVRRYAAWVRARSQEGTRHVKHAATFFGPDCAFREKWSIATEKFNGTVPLVTAADSLRELEEENRKAGYAT